MAHRPTLSPSDVSCLVHNIYGLKVNVLRELNSYDDQNFLVEVINGHTLPSNVKLLNPHGYVFKIFNSLDSTTPEVIETRQKIILHAEKAGYPTPGLTANVENQYQKLMSLPSSRSQDNKLEHYVVSLLSYMPGQTLSQVTLTSQLCYEVGWFAGKLDVILKGFPTAEHAHLKSMTRKWNMSQIPTLRDKLDSITSQQQRSMAEEIINQFEKAILSSEHNFSKGIIHGDFNDCNILVSQDGDYISMAIGDTCGHSVNTISPRNNTFNEMEINYLLQNTQKVDAQPWHVNGVIDFGDTTLSFYIFEVAIAIVHVMINKDGIPALQAASFVLSGYLEHIRLTLDEINHLKLCICARFVQSLIIGYSSIKQDPDNSYILTHAARIWPALKFLWELPDSQVMAQIMKHVTNNQRQ